MTPSSEEIVAAELSIQDTATAIFGAVTVQCIRQLRVGCPLVQVSPSRTKVNTGILATKGEEWLTLPFL